MSNHADLSLLELFRQEAETQTQALAAGLLVLERDPASASDLEQCMRAAHSLKGAARIVGLDAGVKVAHAVEECFVAAQRGRVTLQPSNITTLLTGTDLLVSIANTPEAELNGWLGANVD